MTAVAATGSALDRLLPHFDAETTQRAIVQATPAARQRNAASKKPTTRRS